ncbi:unnamed protein product [Orchesella dallaii]|uniref:Ionotropic glutamate receptor C-terminal domain-containing protein n=1 Tax=Orchesella dallaii TaxID=48710 RepID=A0ABP1Q6T7_9HEXA
MQAGLVYVLTRYPRMRDYHNNPSTYGPIFITGKLIADKLNATLLAKFSAQQSNLYGPLDQYPTINPTIQVFMSGGISVESFWGKYRQSSFGESAQLARLNSLGFNFGYCDTPKIILEKPWNISVLINAFEFDVWLLLIVTMVCLTIVISIPYFSFNHPTLKTRRYWFLLTLLNSILSVLIASNPKFKDVLGLNRSKLLVVWMLASIGLVTYYSGSITSFLIIPPEEDAMKEISQVLARNYSLVFDVAVQSGIVNSTVRSYSLVKHQDMQSAESLLERMGERSIIPNRTEYIRRVAYGRKTVVLYLWPYVLSTINEANILIAKEQPNRSKRRHCYLGKQLLPSGELFFGFSPPGSEQLKKVFQALFETGVYNYWMVEFCEMGYAKRVQDRLKVISPTNILYDFVSDVDSLRMDVWVNPMQVINCEQKRISVQAKWIFNHCTFCESINHGDNFTAFQINTVNTSKPRKFRQKLFKSKYILFDYYWTNQLILDFTLESYPRMRDYYSNPNPYGPIFMPSKIIADALNSTLLAMPNADKTNIHWKQYPLINPSVRFSAGLSAQAFYREHQNSRIGSESVQLLRLESLGFNFGYCDTPTLKHDKPWNIAVLITAFNIPVWVVVILSILSVTCFIRVSIDLFKERSFQQKSSILFSVMSALISFAPSFTRDLRRGHKSFVFVLWMLSCIVLVNSYLGSITSLLISPPEEESMTEIYQLVQRNYSLVFDDPTKVGVLNATLRSYNLEENGLDILDDMRNLKHLLDRLDPLSIIKWNPYKFIYTIAFAKKVAVFHIWTVTLSAINEANAMIARRQKKSSKRRHCYVGKRIISSGEVYFGIVPPGSERIRDVFQAIFQSGVYSYWNTEFRQMSYAKRVQDRIKVKGPTRINYDFRRTVRAIKVEGKVLTVFFLWVVCLICCMVAFGIERLYCGGSEVVFRRKVFNKWRL